MSQENAGIWTSDFGREQSIMKPSRIAAAIVCIASLLFGVTPAAQAAPFAYVPSPDGTVSQYDIGPGGLLAPLVPPTVTTGPEAAAGGAAVSPDGKSAYVTLGVGVAQYDVGPSGALTLKSPATVAAGPSPLAVAVSPDGQSVYVTSSGGHTLAQYSVGTSGTLTPKNPAMVATDQGPFGVA